MIYYKNRELFSGLKIEINNEPYVILEVNFISIGRGQAFSKLKLKNIKTQEIIIKNIKIGEKIKKADITTLDLKLIYSNDEFFYFINNENSEYKEIIKKELEKHTKWIKNDHIYTFIYWNNEIIEIKPPKFIEFEIIDTDDTKKESGTHKNYKNAIIENNIILKVPIFLKKKDIIKIDTETEEYVSRKS